MASDGSGSSSCIWTREDDIRFENALAMYSEDDADRWEKISADVPGKSFEEIKHHYELLVEDVERIEKGLVPIPCYKSCSDGSEKVDDEGTGKKGGSYSNSETTRRGRGLRSDSDRRKGIAWTEEEHKLFLLGLDKFGKGDWRSISRNFVKSRTPTQVASHAQKYFNRLNATNKDRRRSSIHDITSVEGADVSVHQGPITGETIGSSAGAGGGSGSSSKSGKHSLQALGASLPAVGMYGGTTIGQPVSGPLVTAVGTPLSLTQQGHLAFGMRAPVPGSVVPGAPVNMYPMGRPSAHR